MPDSQGHALRMAREKASLHERANSGVGPVCSTYFLGGTTASLTAFATRNFTTVLAGILIAAPV